MAKDFLNLPDYRIDPDPYERSGLLVEGVYGSPSNLESELTLCVCCCTTAPFPPEVVLSLTEAFSSVVTVNPLVITEMQGELLMSKEGAILTVQPGTKLSKLRLLADMDVGDLVCICDPDLSIEPDGCREVVRTALAEACEGKEVVGFGVIESHNDGSLLSKLIAMDKWLSHKVFRRFLWAAHIGITLPGQFLIVSRSLLGRLQNDTDSYLDDLYLGLVARVQRVRVIRVPIVVGWEDSRSCWGSLLTQRIRWMKGLASLWRRFVTHPSAVALLSIHYLVYHGVPIIIGLGMGLLAITDPIAASVLFVGMAVTLSMLSRQSLLTVCCYLIVFPCLHFAATLLCLLPLNKSLLRMR
jgi:cellulose synthase/poly-beta-1,6-N-acetylglucosamine synthase-like glycosyltransferase